MEAVSSYLLFPSVGQMEQCSSLRSFLWEAFHPDQTCPAGGPPLSHHSGPHLCAAVGPALAQRKKEPSGNRQSKYRRGHAPHHANSCSPLAAEPSVTPRLKKRSYIRTHMWEYVNGIIHTYVHLKRDTIETIVHKLSYLHTEGTYSESHWIMCICTYVHTYIPPSSSPLHPSSAGCPPLALRKHMPTV